MTFQKVKTTNETFKKYCFKVKPHDTNSIKLVNTEICTKIYTTLFVPIKVGVVNSDPSAVKSTNHDGLIGPPIQSRAVSTVT